MLPDESPWRQTTENDKHVSASKGYGSPFFKTPPSRYKFSLRMFCFLAPLLLIFMWMKSIAGQPGSAQNISAETTPPLLLIQQNLQHSFDQMLENSEQYEKKCQQDCSLFPEGKIYPYVLPTLAYANLAFSKPEKWEHSRQQMVKLIDLAIPAVTREVQPPGGNLLNLQDYQNHATYLGTFNLALGAFRLATNDTRYDNLNKHLSNVLDTAIRTQKGFPIRSYPAYSWNFDTIIALTSLDVYERVWQTNRTAELVKAHLRWIDEYGTDRTTGLPYSTGWNRADPKPSPPRGCDISMRLCLMSQLAPTEAKILYERYVAAHWVDHGFIAGFTEWPKGTNRAQDVDSGPIFMGLGSTASGMGLGVAIAMDDKAREQKLAGELLFVHSVVQLLASGKSQELAYPDLSRWFEKLGLPLDSRYVTGFLYGDAALFYAVTWAKYPKCAQGLHDEKLKDK